MIAQILLWFIVLIVIGTTVLIKGQDPENNKTRRELLLIAAVALAALLIGGCSTLRPDGFGSELSHNSGLLIDGCGSDGRLREDSLDVFNNYVYWQRGTWYAEAGVGLKVREGGFYLDGPPIVFNGRVGRRFSFGER